MDLHIQRVSLHENYVEGSSFAHRLDARVKIVSAIILLFLIVSTRHMAFVLFPVTTVTLLLLRFPVRRLFLPSAVVTTVFLVVLLTHGGERVVWQWWIFSITDESVSFSILILTRVLASLGVVFTLLATTRTVDILASLRWMRVPKTVIDLSYLMLRYVGLLSREAERMYLAAKSRYAFSPSLPYSKRVRNLGMLAGSLLLKALDRSERVYMGMVSKGYDGELRYGKYGKFGLLDFSFLALTTILALLALHLDGVIP